MNTCLRGACFLLFAALACPAPGGQQDPGRPPLSRDAPQDADATQYAHLPNGKSQRDEILKEEHAQNLRDATQLLILARQLRQEVAKDDRYVLSLSSLKKTDEIDKLARKIRSRMRHN